MPDKFSFGTIQSAGEPLEVPTPESPFRIGILGDFSGRKNRGESESLADQRPVRVNRENFDEVMANLAVRLVLPVGDIGPAIELSFSSLDDFHPDQLHGRVDYIADADEVDQKSTWLSWVLHHPDFQAVESAWRGLDWLLGRAAKGGRVEVTLFDISLAELTADLNASEDLTATGLHELLIDKGVHGPRGEPWAILVGNYAFDLSVQHAELLGRIAKIAGQSNAPFLAAVDPRVLEKSFALSPEATAAWQALRQLPEAGLLGLAAPRFLLRLPYGDNTQSIDKFSYEEMTVPPDRSHYLWGNPALACAALLAQAFHKDGWAFKPGVGVPLENLPIHVYHVDGEEEVTLAEAWLVRPQIEQIVKLGLMVFLCVRGKGAMQLLRFQSLAQPAKDQPACELQGRWRQSGVASPPRTSTPPAAKVGMVGQTPPPPRPVPAPVPAKPAVTAPPAKPAPPPAPVVPKAAPTPELPPAPEAPPAEEEMDPDLAALLKQLE
jgi:hypothetical protein